MSPKEDIKFKKKKKLGSYPYFSVVFSNTIALFVIGLFAIILLQSRKLTEVIRNNIEIQIYLDKQISESNISRLRNILSNSNYILKINESPQIRFISDEEAAQKFIVDTGEDFTEFLGDNPLRDAFVIKINPEYQDITSLNDIKKNVERLQGVYEVIYMESLITSINKNTTKISMILIGVMVVMLVIVLVLINNTVKLALFSQRFLIRSMQLVGAKSSFIQWPFLRRSIIHGFISGLFASFVLYNIVIYANKKIDGLSDLQSDFELIMVFISISILGSVIGFLSTFRSVSKYLKMSLDELY
jgi:cell division transport system permease protein